MTFNPLILKFGIFLDMLSTHEQIGFQSSLQGNSRIDAIVANILESHASSYIKKDYRKLWGNDEMFYNGPGFEIPTIGLGRIMHREYHYDSDNLANIDMYHLVESVWYLMRIIEVFETDYIPILQYRGPLYLSRHNLDIAPIADPQIHENIERLQIYADGNRSCMDISALIGLDFFGVRNFFDQLIGKDLVIKKERKPSADDTGYIDCIAKGTK